MRCVCSHSVCSQSPKKDERSSDDKEKEKAPSSGSGGVRLAADDAELITISHMGESEIFGEITYLEGRTASATVVASSDAVDVRATRRIAACTAQSCA